MIKATKIKMKEYKETSNSVLEIDSVFLEGVSVDRFYKREKVYDFIKENPFSEIKVNIYPYPKLIAATNGTQKYVRSEQNTTSDDNLLKLPRE